jgi:hypothetical protein
MEAGRGEQGEEGNRDHQERRGGDQMTRDQPPGDPYLSFGLGGFGCCYPRGLRCAHRSFSGGSGPGTEFGLDQQSVMDVRFHLSGHRLDSIQRGDA